MNNYRDGIEAGAMLLAYITLINTAFKHKDIEQRDYQHHKEELECLLTQHNEEVKLQQETYLQNMIVDMERHFQQLNADLLSATRASESDMYDQRNKQCQTLILSATIMLNALVTMMIQGILPKNDDNDTSIPDIALYIYSISLNASLGFLFLCIIIYILLVIKTSKFMYRKRAQEYTKQFSEATKATKFVFDEHSQVLTNRSKDSWEEKSSYNDDNDNKYFMNKRSSIFQKLSKKFSKIGRRSKGNDNNNDNNNDTKEINTKNNSSSTTTDFSSNDFISIDIENIEHFRRGNSDDENIDHNNFYYKDDIETNELLYNPHNNPFETPKSIHHHSIRKKIFDLDLPVLEQEYTQHDEIIKRYLRRRDRINKNYSKFLFGDNTFDNFWDNNCNIHHQLGILTFYVGTGLLLIAQSVYNWLYFTYNYKSTIGANASASIIGMSLLLGILFRLSFQILQNQTSKEWESIKYSKKS